MLPMLKWKKGCVMINVSNYTLISDIDIGTVIKEVVVLLNETNAVLKGEQL